jgi:hypothetical protein
LAEVKAPSNKVPAGKLRPGMVIDRHDALWLVVSQETPAATVPMPEAEKLCEPGLVQLAYQRDDRWLQTHYFTYMCFRLDEDVTVNDSIRVQVPDRNSRYLNERERIFAMSYSE